MNVFRTGSCCAIAACSVFSYSYDLADCEKPAGLNSQNDRTRWPKRGDSDKNLAAKLSSLR